MHPVPGHTRALRLVIVLNVLCLLVAGGVSWMSGRKAAETTMSQARFRPLENKVRDLIETEREIEKLRELARMQNISASGSMEALLHVTRAAPSALLPFAAMPLATIVIAGVALRRMPKAAGRRR